MQHIIFTLFFIASKSQNIHVRAVPFEKVGGGIGMVGKKGGVHPSEKAGAGGSRFVKVGVTQKVGGGCRCKFSL